MRSERAYDASTLVITRFFHGALIAALCVPAQKPAQTPTPAAAPADVAAVMASLPTATVKPLDPASALLFSALPLTCVDDLQPRPTATRPYFWQPTYRTVDAYDKTRAFYGCNDWPTAVGATWTLVALLKRYPDLGSGQLIREKLNAHLGRENLDGEFAYFRTAGNAQRPYGYAWFLRLYAELATWKDPDGARYAENATPLARFFADGLVGYLVDLEKPNRTAGQANSAFSLGLLLDYVDATRDMTIKRAVSDAARRMFQRDTACETNTEAASPEMVSPCLEEASVMSRVLDAEAFLPWFDKFLPPPSSDTFKPLLSISFDAVGGRGRGNGRGAAAAGSGRASTPAPPATTAASTQTGAATSAPAASAALEAGAGGGANGGRGGTGNSRANWIGLAFTRANAFSRLAAALPAGEPRTALFRRLADIHAENGQREVVTAAAFDAPWVGALAVSYLAAIGGAR
jgi:hypothetical protein